MRRLLALLSVLFALTLFVPSLVIAQTGTPEPEAMNSARTNLQYVLPFGPDGVKGALTVTEEIGGSCAADSLALPYRPDAWDCTGDDGQLYDPCFADPFAAEDAPLEVACLTSPFTTEVVLLTLDEPLPEAKAPPAQDLFLAQDLPWAIELANGDRCVLLLELDTVLAGETVHYSCENGGSVLGVVDHQLPLWAVNYVAPDAVTSTLVDVVAAWS